MPSTVLGTFVGSVAVNYCISIPCPDWLPEAKTPCQTSDPDLFFPGNYGLKYHRQIAEAKAACAECPFQVQCLEWALSRSDLDGIWAGTTPIERSRMRSRVA